MKEQFGKLYTLWKSSDDNPIAKVTDQDVKLFQLKNEIVMPKDLVDYFKLINGSDGKYVGEMFQFYSFDAFIRISDGLKNWGGVPDYRNIVNTLDGSETCFLIADHCFHLFTYAIRLYPKQSDQNEVYVICGDKHKIIASSFSEFVELYLDDSIELYFT